MPGLPPRIRPRSTGSVDLAPGEYTLRTISDNGIRVWVDSALVIDNWKPHESALDFAPLTGGHHDFRVQYYRGRRLVRARARHRPREGSFAWLTWCARLLNAMLRIEDPNRSDKAPRGGNEASIRWNSEASGSLLDAGRAGSMLAQTTMEIQGDENVD